MNATKRLRAYLKSEKRNQAWLARELGVTESHVSQIFAGHRKPSLDLASKIESLTGIAAREFSKVA